MTFLSQLSATDFYSQVIVIVAISLTDFQLPTIIFTDSAIGPKVSFSIISMYQEIVDFEQVNELKWLAKKLTQIWQQLMVPINVRLTLDVRTVRTLSLIDTL